MDELENQLIQSYFKEGQSPADIQESQIAEKEIKSRYGQKTGAGLLDAVLTPEQRLLFGIAQGTLSRKDRLTPTQSIPEAPSQIPQMPQQYDTSPYRALDIIGAGIARRPTQESYFNQLEKMQNARLEDAYNRRTDTEEAKNLQGLIQKTFPNLDKDIVSKISPDYFSKNYPLIAQIAERETSAMSKATGDQEAKQFIKEFYPEINQKQLNLVNATNYKEIAKKFDDIRAKKAVNPQAKKLDATTLRKSQEDENATLSYINKLNDMKKYIDSNGFSVNDVELGNKYADFLAAYKEVNKLGALDSGVLQLVNKALPDPTSLTSFGKDIFSSDFKNNYLKTIDEISKKSIDSFANYSSITGYEPKVLTNKYLENLKGNEKKQKYEEGQFYPDGKGGYFKWMNGKAVPVPK